MTRLHRLLVLASAILLLGGLSTAFVLHSTHQHQPSSVIGELTLTQAGRLVFVGQAGAVSSVPAADPGASRTTSGLTCARFYAAASTGVCLQSTPGVLQQNDRALVVDSALHPVHSVPLAGTPSRARVSPSGHLVAWTVFVGGESYGSAFFSTRTSILDTRSWQLLPDIEEFAITMDGLSYHAADTNFWGVTFAADDDTFYATLGTGGRTYLVRGSVSRRTVTTLVQNVECPSLSPDGTRIAFKKRTLPGAALWHEYVLDLRTLHETPLAERRSVDDQAAWLDDHTLAYALPTDGTVGGSDLWTAPADGTGTPHLLIPGATSPAALH